LHAGLAGAVVGLLVGLMTAALGAAESSLAEFVWLSVPAVVLVGIVVAVAVPGRRPAGVALSVGSVIGFVGFWLALFWWLASSGAFGN
jgi:hypothetical protein